jgi:hypothetical protein
MEAEMNDQIHPLQLNELADEQLRNNRFILIAFRVDDPLLRREVIKDKAERTLKELLMALILGGFTRNEIEILFDVSMDFSTRETQEGTLAYRTGGPNDPRMAI